MCGAGGDVLIDARRVGRFTQGCFNLLFQRPEMTAQGMDAKRGLTELRPIAGEKLDQMHQVEKAIVDWRRGQQKRAFVGGQFLEDAVT